MRTHVAVFGLGLVVACSSDKSPTSAGVGTTDSGVRDGDTADTDDTDPPADTADSGEPVEDGPLAPIGKVDEDRPDIALAAPNYGFDFATDQPTVTIEGAASEGVVEVRWSIDGGASGVATGTTAWSAAGLVLQEGDNHIVFTADTGAATTSIDLQVTHNPGVALQSDLLIDLPGLSPDQPTELSFGVWADGVDRVEVGPTDAAGALTEVWTTLSEDPDTPGWFTGSATITLSSDTDVRALAHAGPATGRTPPTLLRAVPARSETDWQADVDAHEALVTLIQAGEPDAAEAALAGDSTLLAWSRDDEAFWYVDAQGVTWLIDLGDEDERGHGALAPSATFSARPTTTSSTGVAGPPPPLQWPTGTEAWFYEPFAGDFSTSTTKDSYEAARLALGSCTVFDTASHLTEMHADVDELNTGLEEAGLAVFDGHGDFKSVVRWRRRGVTAWSPKVELIATGEAVSPAQSRHLAAQLATGQVVIGTYNRKGVTHTNYSVSPYYIRARTAKKRMPGTVVVLNFCSGMRAGHLDAALRSGGASYVVGFSHVVHSSYSDPKAKTFIAALLDEDSTGDAFARIQTTTPDDTTTPAVPKASGATDVELVYGDITLDAGGFEDSSAWDYRQTYSYDARWSYVTGTGARSPAVPTEGSQFIETALDADEGTQFALLSQDICVPKNAKISFDAVFSTLFIGSSTRSWILGLRAVDANTGAVTQLWQEDWSHLQPRLTDSGAWQTTGWQSKSVDFPAAVEGQQVSLEFTMYGYEWDMGVLGLDKVVIAPR